MHGTMTKLKRKLPFGDGANGEPLRKKEKNAVCALYEMFRNVVFKVVDQAGPVHMPVFTMSVEVNGNEYRGQGKNKKLAKQAAAAAALDSIIQYENPAYEDPVKRFATTLDFTNDLEMSVPGTYFDSPIHGNAEMEVENCLKISSNSHEMASGKKASSTEKGPVMLLNELHPNAVYEIVSEKGEQYNKYTTVVVIDEQRFQGTGASKKLSKAAAAKSALASLHNINYSSNPVVGQVKTYVSPEFELNQTFADCVATLVVEKFTAVMGADKDHSKRKVLAGIVMSEGLDPTSCRVVAVSTGTKCVKGEHMSVNGATVYDCHAEIIARRCFKRFLYNELKKSKTMENNSIFKKCADTGGFALKPNVQFHLYISTAPCGDSRIFAPHDEDLEDKHPNRNSRGKLRTKIESGEGTIPVKGDEPIQTWDGIIQGERLLTMSCSDKIARWNVLGLQGSLLSKFIEPIYLESIILGSLFHPDHLHRAVIGRVQNFIQGLPYPFHINAPKMALISSKEVRNTGKAPNFSVNWTEGDESFEVVNATTGKTEEQQVSRLAKRNLFEAYVDLLRIWDIKLLASTYAENKALATDYHLAKDEFNNALVRANQGKWVKKPPESEQFGISL